MNTTMAGLEKNAKRRIHAWFALADEESCRLFRCSLTKRGTHHVVEHEVLKKTMLEQEFVRPMTEGGGKSHYVEEQERRFAGQIVVWLQEKAGEHQIDRLMIIATPRMLGALRKVPHGSLKGQLDECKGDLMRLEAGQLAEHPMIRDLMRAPPAT